MYKVVISGNTDTPKKQIFLVTKRQYEQIRGAANIGGFKRFNVDLSDDAAPENTSEFYWAISFIAVNLLNVNSVELKKEIERY